MNINFINIRRFTTIIVLGVFLGIFQTGFAQGPNAPEAGSFEPIDAVDMINLVTGDFSYVLPLLDVPSPEGGYPLTLAYHSNIAMGQDASWVGLGWNINPGAVMRNVSGIPDDWRRSRKYTSIYNAGGVSKSISVGVGVGINGFGMGIYASYSENKTFGGENSYGFDVGVNASIGVGDFGIGGSLGTDGVGLGVGYSPNGLNQAGPNFGVNVSQSFKNGSTSVGLNVGGNALSDRYAVPSASMGVTFNTKGGLFLSSNQGGSSAIGAMDNTGLNFKNDSFSITIPFYCFNISFGYSRSKYWLYEMDYHTFNGSLYAGDMDELLLENNFNYKVAFDSYEALYGPNAANQLDNTNFNYIGYDSYSVSGQGISGSMQPILFEEGVLFNKEDILTTYDSGTRNGGTSFYYPENNQNGSFTKSLNNNNLYFYFNNENSSFLKLSSDTWNIPNINSNYGDISAFNTTNQSLNSIVTIGGEQNNGYNSSIKRMRTGSFIEVFTNEEINSYLTSGNQIQFIEANNLIRGVNYPKDGIGAFRITTTDGRTYHYSLPVYQREMFSRTGPLDKNINDNFFEESQFEPYATHWLLTAITGPDYVDINGNFKPDQNDYGYWVIFEYGKWSDGYTWRSPTTTGFEQAESSKRYQWGAKEVYYLDRIKTRTHTALFIKELRSDNYSSTINIRNGNNPIVYDDNHTQSFTQGDDGLYYVNGVYDSWKPTLNSPITNFFATSKHKIYVKTNNHRSLKLRKIILLDNENPYANISTSRNGEPNPILSGEIDVNEEYLVWYLNGSLYSNFSKHIYDRSFYGEYFSKVLDRTDISMNAPDIEDNALKVIEFDHSYSLMPQSPNSNSIQKSRLTLDAVYSKGKGGAILIPPYTFEYQTPTKPYNLGDKDAWGYCNYAQAWNLNKIITPVGETLNVNYEEDTFHQEATESNIVFGDNKFVMKFTGADPGNKWITFKNNPNNEPGENIQFQNHFEVNTWSRVNVQYIFDPNGSKPEERVADVDQMCRVVEVTPTFVRFELPLISVGNYERTRDICQKSNWQYYNWYSAHSNNHQSVVERTANWIGEHDQNNCDEVNTGDHRCRIQFYSSKAIIDQEGGGSRVKELMLRNENNDIFKTTYNYNVPGTNTSSGITSYEPSTKNKEVKFITELPAPTVMYEYVTVTNENINGQPVNKDVYHFEVLKPINIANNGFEIDNLLSLSTSQNSVHSNVNINSKSSSLKLSKFNLINNLANLGRLKSKTTYNRYDQILEKVNNEYLSNTEIKQGIKKETFKSYKKVSSIYFYNNPRYYLSSSSKTFYPSVLKSTEIIKGGLRFKQYFVEQDFLTGENLVTDSQFSDGTLMRTQLIPAYKKYNQMGGKVDNQHDNRNMLSQISSNYVFLSKSGEWKPIGVGIQTWNKEWAYKDRSGNQNIPYNGFEKVWRKHKTFVWDGNIDGEGKFLNFNVGNDDGFNWTAYPIPPSQPEPWKQVSEITQYDHFSRPLEIKDINNNFMSTKTWDKNTKIVATANAAHGEIFYSSAEYLEKINNIKYFGQQITSTADSTSFKSHTGKYSLGLNTGQYAFKVIMPQGSFKAGKFRLSVWAHKENYNSIRIDQNNSLNVFNGEKIFAGNWVQLNHYLELNNTQQTISLKSSSGVIYVDDFRLQPIESSMTSYVFNDYDELTYMLGSNNLATKYQYDQAGRLIRIFQETVNTPTISGGFKLAKEYRYNYKRELPSTSGGGDDPPPLGPVYFDDIVPNTGPQPTTAILYGDPGTLVEIALSIFCFNNSSNNGSAIFIVDGNTYTLSGCGALQSGIAVTIPQEGFVNCSIKFNNTVGPPDNYARIQLTSTNPPFLITDPDKFDDLSEFN